MNQKVEHRYADAIITLKNLWFIWIFQAIGEMEYSGVQTEPKFSREFNTRRNPDYISKIKGNPVT